MSKIRDVICVVVAAVVLASATGVVAATNKTLRVYVSILPQRYFVERIGGAHVHVDVLVGPGHSPATYEPTPKQMARMGRAGIYFRIGTPFEKGFVRKISDLFPDLDIVDMQRGIPLLYFEGSHEASVPDPHTWLDPKRVKLQATIIYDALRRLDPAHDDVFKHNLHRFHADLDALDARITAALAAYKGRSIYVFHPAFGYFCDSYGLTQVAIETEGKQPSPKQLARVIRTAQTEKVKIIFVQPQFARRDAQALAQAIKGAVVPINPLPENYVEDMEALARAIEDGLTQ